MIKNLMLSMTLILGLGTGGPALAGGEHDAPASHLYTGSHVVGDQWRTGNYCVGENSEFIRRFTDEIVRGGVNVYWRFMNEPQTPCYDARIHSFISAIVVTLKKKMWSFELPSGEKLTMWLAADLNGALGYVWIPQEGETI